MTRKSIWEHVSTAVLVASAAAIAGTAVSRELRSRAPGPQRSVAAVRSDWKSFASSGRLTVGPDDAAVTVVVFSDYTCRFCKELDQLLQSSQAKFGKSLRIQYRHYPRESIPGARLAALALECAAGIDRGWTMHRALFVAQDSLGALSSRAIADMTGSQDTDAIERCLSDERTAAGLAADVDAGKRLGVRVTPTMLVNERVIAGAPTAAALDELLRQAGAVEARGVAHEPK